MELSFEDGETVYVGHVDDVDVILDITLDGNNNVCGGNKRNNFNKCIN
jgi:hypothetical protein